MIDPHGRDPRFRDFKNFLYALWQHLGLPPPTRVQYEMADFLQSNGSRKFVAGYRAVGKSWITSAYVLWCLYWNPGWNILVVSAAKERADAFSQFCLRLLFDVTWLQWLAPKPDQRSALHAFDVAPAGIAHAASVRSVGVTGMIVGARAHLIVADDIETPENAATPLARERLHERVKGFVPILHPEGGTIVYLGTPQTEESVYTQLCKPSSGYQCRFWPVRYPNPSKVANYGGNLAPSIAEALAADPSLEGALTDPARFTEAELRAREAELGLSGTALQYQLDTTLSDLERYPLRLTDLVVTDVSPTMAPTSIHWGCTDIQRDLPIYGFNRDAFYRPAQISTIWEPYEVKVLSIDPSGRGKDELAISVLGRLHGNIYLLHSSGYHNGYSPETLGAIAKHAVEFGVNKIVYESNYGDGMFVQLLKPYLEKANASCGLEEVRAKGQKELRIIETLEPLMNQHKLIVSKAVVMADAQARGDLSPADALSYRLFWQMPRITKDRESLPHDDRLDALALGVSFLVSGMAVDQDLLKRERDEALFEEHVARRFPGSKKTNKTWLPAFALKQ